MKNLRIPPLAPGATHLPHRTVQPLRWYLLHLALFLVLITRGAVSTHYTFSATAGTYSEITGGTALWTNTFDDDVSGAQTIPAFAFDGTTYTTMFVSSNGFITFGSAPAADNYAPLSSTATYARCVAAFAQDMVNQSSGTRDVRWRTIGTETIIQWRGIRRYRNIIQTWNENYSFQIRLDHSTGIIRVVYGPIAQGPANSTNMPQVGLRGPNNTFATNVNTIRVESGAETWANPLAGNANTNTLRFTGSAPAKSWTSGQTYTWTPPCVVPTATFSVVDNCGGGTFNVVMNLTAFGAGTSGVLSYEVNGGATSNQAVSALGNTTVGPFPTSAVVTARFTNALPACSTAEYTAVSNCPVQLACINMLPVQHCYTNNDTRTFSYTATPGNTVNLLFVAGTIDPNDIIRIYDGLDNNGTLLASSSSTNLNGLTATSTGQDLYMEISSNGSNSCASGQQSTWQFEVRCTPACTSPDGAVTVLTDCGSSSFDLDVEVLFTGDEPTTTLWYSVDGGPAQTVPGLVDLDVAHIGPFALTSSVNVRLVHAAYAICDRNLGNFTRDQVCPPANDACANAQVLSVKTPAQCPGEATTGTTLDAGTEQAAPSCNGTGTIADVWYRFNSGFNTSPIQIALAAGTAGHYAVELYSACGGTLISCTPNSPSVVNLSNAPPYTDYWVRVFTNTTLGAAGSFSICVSASPIATACGQVVRDPGGTGNYSNNQNVTTTYCSGSAGEVVTMTFTQFATEQDFDFVRIYNGPSTASPLLGTFSGTTIPGPFTSTHPSGCLTVNFTSNFLFVAAGYTANLSCCVAPTPTASASSSGPACEGGTLQLNCSTNIGTVFAWTGPNGFSSALQNPAITNVSAAAAGLYTVTVRNGVNGCPISSSTTAVVNPSPTALSVNPPTPLPFCAGGSVALTATGGATSSLVTTGGTSSTTSGNVSTSALGPNPLQNYYGGAKQQMMWRASELSALGLVAGSQITSLAIDLATANTAYALNNFRIKYQWSSTTNALTTTPVSTGWTGIFPAQNVTPQVGFNTFTFTAPITWNGTDNLLIELNYSNNNTGTSGTFNTARFATGLPYNATSFYRVDGASASTVNNYSMTMTNVYAARNHTRLGVALPGIYTWSPSGGLNTTSGPNVTAAPGTTQTYTVTSTNTFNCSNSTTVVVTVNPNPATPTITAGGPTTFCAGGSVTLTSSSATGNTWSTGATTQSITVSTSGTYTVTVTDGNGCSATSAGTTVTVNPNPTTPTISAGGPTTFCAGGSVTLTSSSATGNTWSTGATTQSITMNASGNYTVTVTDGNGCSATSAGTTVTVNPNPATPTITPDGPLTFCAGGSVTLTSSSATGNTWSTGATTQSIIVNASGNYTVTVTNGNGCSATSASTAVTVNPNPATPTMSADGPLTFCAGGSVTLTSSSAAGNTWSTGATTPSITVSASGTYTVTVTDGNGCSATSAGTTVTVNPNPATPTITPDGPTTFCAGGSVTLTSSSATDNSWSTGATTSSITVNASGNYTVTVTNGNGCSATSASTTVTVNPNPIVSCGTYAPRCSSDANVSLVGTPSGGTWSGNGVAGNSFDPSAGTSTLTYTYTDGNGCSASCQTTISVTPATAWYADADGDGFGDAASMTLACVQPSGYVLNSTDNCPSISGLIGDACAAGPGFVLGQIDANCACVGQQCTTDLTLEFSTDINSFENTWELRTQGTNILVQSGGGWYPPNATLNDQTCVPDGCYVLRVLDAGGDGMNTGGYILRTLHTNERIIDNRNNFSYGSVSTMAAGQAFCLPMGTTKPIYTSCDKMDWASGQYLVAAPDPAVSAQWQVGNQSDDGYEFWIFDPNGSYSFRRFRSHHQSDGFGPASAVRACHMKLNNWSIATQIPGNVMMNVRIRSRVNGVNGAFGPACRMAINPMLAACPRTKLMDIPNDPDLSCGAIRPWGAGNFIHARPVSGANLYQFRFRIAAEGFEVVRTSSTYFMQLNWTTLPLQDGKTYDVDVRVSKNNGATWCHSGASWGDVCQFTIGNVNVNANSLMADGQQNDGAEPVTASAAKLFPNPNRGDLLNLSISAIEEGVHTVSVDIFDLSGKRKSARNLAVAGTSVITTMDLGGELAAGTYVVHITAGSSTWTERLVIQP